MLAVDEGGPAGAEVRDHHPGGAMTQPPPVRVPLEVEAGHLDEADLGLLTTQVCGAAVHGKADVVVLVACCLLLWGGITYGFNGMKPILLDQGMYAFECEGHGNRSDILAVDGIDAISSFDLRGAPEAAAGVEEHCPKQLERIDFIFAFASSMLNVCALPNGMLLDRYGLRRVCTISGIIALLCVVPLCVSVTNEGFHWAFPYIYTLMAESGIMLLLGGMSLQSLAGGLVACGKTAPNAVFTAPAMETTFALASLVLPALALIYFSAPGKGMFQAVFGGYTSFCAVVVMWVGRKVPREQVREVRGWGHWKHAHLYAASAALTAAIVQQGYYIATAAEQFERYGEDEKDALITWFDISFPLASLPTMVAVAQLQRWLQRFELRKAASAGYLGLALGQLLWGVLSAIPLYHLQYVTIAVFVPVRMWGFVHFYRVISAWYPRAHFGFVVGGCLTLGGLSALPFTSALQTWLVTHLDRDPLYPNIVLTIALVAANVLAACVLPQTAITAEKGDEEKNATAMEEKAVGDASAALEVQ